MERYERLTKVGEGSYGVVYRCRHRETGLIVAIKKFTESEDDPAIKKIAMREVRMLKQLKHPNLINLFEVFKRNRKIHLVFEYCERTVLDDLEKYPAGCPEPLIKKTIYQLIQGVNFCHKLNVLHRDIKPENILISQDSVKLADFGFARTMNSNELYTDYVATRWYRCPELLVADVDYGTPVDIWAIGCVLAEMILGDAIWPGRSDIDQLYLIIKTMGNLIERHAVYFHENPYYRGLSIPSPDQIITLDVKFAEYSSATLDILKKCFQMNPEKRASASELLTHPYFQGVQLPIIDTQPQDNIFKRKTNNALPMIPQTSTVNSPLMENKEKKNFIFSNLTNNVRGGYLPMI
uniref:Protein kinase domain-containing protein n=1 Tax=Rhabditophanes sp. KR3021 TaxID=114890 RepID=A0AC35UDU1_9BILA